MATQKEILERLDTAATNAENATDAYYEVLTTEGEQDIALVDGTTTPNLNKRLAKYSKAVTSVAGRTGDVLLTPDDIGYPELTMLDRREKESRFIVDESGKTQQEINDIYKSRTTAKFYAVDYGLKTTNSAYNNTLALQALASAVNSNNGGHVIFPYGVHEIGHQVLAGNETSGASWIFSQLFHIHDCKDQVLIEFNQTVLKFKDGMRHGAFDPITGVAVANGGVNSKYHAGYGRAIELRNNANIRIIGSGRVDGNDAKAIVGGTYGDAGRQCVSYALYAINNKIFTADTSLVLHNMPLDGLYNSGLNLTDSVHDIRGIVSMYNGRQAFSLTGGWNQTYTNCYFGKTGMGNFPSSAPAANLDTEAEITGSIKNVNFNGCVFSDAIGGSIVSEFPATRDVKFNFCTIENSKNVAIYCKSEMIFNDCNINGKVEPFFSTFKESPAKINNCTVSMQMQDGTPAYVKSSLFSDGGSDSVYSEISGLALNYDFDSSNQSIALYLASNGNKENITLNIKGDPSNLAGASIAVLAGIAQIKGLMVNDSSKYLSAVPNLRKSIEGGGLSYLTNAFITKNANGDENILWANPFYSAGGRSGWWSGGYVDREDRLLEPKEISILKNGFGPSNFYDGGQIMKSSSSGVPTTGYFRFGTIVWNANPATGQPIGWMCTVGGTAGVDAVFKSMGNLA